MQCSVIEFARDVIGLEKAHTTEIDPQTPDPVIALMEEQVALENKGGTMRLGSYKCSIKPDTKAAEVYANELINERHRHRYEFNNAYLESFEKHGMIASGINPDNNLVEIVEIPDHPWFIGVQFHPEYKSTVASPHPLFVGFVKAAVETQKVLEKA
jgi:CTP synthase